MIASAVSARRAQTSGPPDQHLAGWVRIRDIQENRPPSYRRTVCRRQAIDARLIDKAAQKAPIPHGRNVGSRETSSAGGFFILAYALSWWPWILYALGLTPNPIASFGLLALVWTVVAVLVVVITGPTDLSRKYRKQEEALPGSEPASGKRGV